MASLRLCLVSFLFLFGCASMPTPRADLDPAFLGTWEGRWFGGVGSRSLEFSTGAYAVRIVGFDGETASLRHRWGPGQDEHGELRGRLTPDGALEAEGQGSGRSEPTSTRATYRYVLSEDGTVLTVTRVAATATTHALLHRVGAAILWQKLPELPDIPIEPAAPEVPASLAALLGTWEGEWTDGKLGRLVVRQVSRDRATVVYAWSNDPIEGSEADFTTVTATVNAGERKLSWAPGRRFTFQLSADGRTLQGLRYARGTPIRVTMRRASDQAPR